MPFRSIVGHRHVIELLARAVARDGLPPSLILAGPEGVGKRRVALALAQALNCLAPIRGRDQAAGGLPFDACGTCAACKRIERGVHPDVMLIEPEDEGGGIKVEKARAISDQAAYRPYEGRRRVVVIDPADALERFAQNALLKLLEEPPPATVLVLVTSQPDLLLATVRSRCPQIRLGPLTVAEITEILTRERKVPAHEARAAAVLASGSASRALEAASDETSEARAQALQLLRDAAPGRDRQGLMSRMQAVLGIEKRQGTAAAEREQVSLALRAMSALLRDLVMLSESGVEQHATTNLANADLEDDLGRLSPSFGRDRVIRAYAAVDRALAALRGNASPKLVVDWLAFHI